jgi:hypothetical protein
VLGTSQTESGLATSVGSSGTSWKGLNAFIFG